MKVKVRFFAQLRDVAKSEEVEIELQQRATVGDLSAVLEEKFPALRAYLGTVSFAVDSEYATRDTRLRSGCEVALLPPISGG